tara:strand:+ start:138 stop:377 length:240 start_codon:yes stop_codon:yes gene_type:complete
MDDINILIEHLKQYVETQISFMREDKPNLAFFWRRYMDVYINRIIKILKQMESVNENEFMDKDFTREQIMLLYLMSDLN